MDAQAEAVAGAVNEPLIIFDNRLTSVAASSAYYTLLGSSPNETLNRPIRSLPGSLWQDEALVRALQATLASGEPASGLTVLRDGVRLAIRASQWPAGEGGYDRLLVALRVEVDELHALLSALDDVVVVIDSDGRVLQVLTPIPEDYPYRLEAVVGRTLDELLPPENARLAMRDIRQALSMRSTHCVQFSVPLGSRTAWFRARYTPLDANRVIMVAHDISALKEAEAALRESHERFYRMFHASPVAIALARASDTRIVDVNDAWITLLGYERDEAIGADAEQMGLLGDPEDFARILGLIKERGALRSAEFDLRRKSGEIRTALVSMEAVNINGEMYLLGLAQDITDRKRVETLLRESEERFALIFRSSPAPLMLVRLSDRMVIDANPAWLQLHALPRQSLVGRNAEAFRYLVEPEQVAAMEAEFRRQGRVSNFEMAIRTAQGQSRIVLFSAEPVTMNGEACLLCAAFDVTARQDAEQRMLRTAIEREYALRLAQAIADIARDLQKPITTQRASASLIRRMLERLRERAREITAIAQDVRSGLLQASMTDINSTVEALRARTRTLDDSLEHVQRQLEVRMYEARLEHRLGYAFGPQDFNALVRRAASSQRAMAAEYGVTQRVELDTGQPVVVVDQNEIDSALRNLIAHAIRITPDQGSVAISTAASSEMATLTVVGMRNPGLTSSTSDPGMLQDSDELAVVRLIVAAHDGKFEAAPSPEGGTVFRMHLPLHRA